MQCRITSGSQSDRKPRAFPDEKEDRHIIFERFPSVKIERPAKFGGDFEFKTYAELEAAFVSGSLHPADAKAGAAKHINLLLDPVREHFEKNEKARELKAQVDGFKVTR